MQVRMDTLAQMEGEANPPAPPSLEPLQNIINESAQQNAQLLAGRINQVHQVLNRAIDRVKENDTKSTHAAALQKLQTQIQEAEQKSAFLTQTLQENTAILKERQQQNITLTQKLHQLAAIKQRPAPPSYGEIQLSNVSNQLAKNYRENRNGSRR